MRSLTPQYRSVSNVSFSVFQVMTSSTLPGRDDATVLHQDDAIGELRGDVEVVHHDEARELAVLHLAREQLVEIELVAHVEERARLVEEEHLRLLHERTRDRDALLLAAAQRMRRALGERDEIAALERLADDRARRARVGRIHAP